MIRFRVELFEIAISTPDEELREIELEENVGRLDLTPKEASKARLREIERMAAELSDTDVTQMPKRGRPDGPAHVLSGGDEKKHSALKQEISRNRRHVEAAEVHPQFADQQWKRSRRDSTRRRTSP